MFNQHDVKRDSCMLHGPLAHHGYDWWWHSFTAQDAETGEDKPFFIEFFVCNPALAEEKPVTIGGGIPSLPRMLKPGRASLFSLSFLFATPRWRRRCLSWDSFRRTRP